MSDRVFTYGDPVWIKPEDWRGEIFCPATDERNRPDGENPLYLVSIVGQNRARWCRLDELERR